MDGAAITLAFTVVLFVLDIVFRVLAVIFVPRNRRPATAAAWLLAILFLPYVGIALFLLFGSRRLPKRRRDKQHEINTFILESTEGIDEVAQTHLWPKWLESVVRLNRTLGAMPLVGGNTVRIFGEYGRSLHEMTEEMGRANRFVHVEFYILAFDRTTAPFFQAMEDAVRRGVTVRVLMDHVASVRSKGYGRTKRRLREAGVEWHVMLPVQPWRGRWQRPDLRNHRKLLVVDGRTAFMGSQNVIDRSYNKRGNIRRGLQWQDLMLRLEGPIVAGLNAIFITDWYGETDELLLREGRQRVEAIEGERLDCQVVPSGPGFDGENNLRLFNTLLYSAQKRIVITSPYFVPDDSMLYSITTAVQRGVEVELFVSEIGDQPLVYHAQRSYYEELLRAGVRILLHRAPTILHAKHFTIDDDVAVVGSSNMDMRSFSLNFELSLMIRGREFVDQLRQIQAGYRRASRILTLDEWQRRPRRTAVLDNVARLTAAVQ